MALRDELVRLVERYGEDAVTRMVMTIRQERATERFLASIPDDADRPNPTYEQPPSNRRLR